MKRVGIIGAGQLGQMLGNAGKSLGIECEFLDPADDPPAASCGTVARAAFDDAEAIAAMARRCDVITYEFENVPVGALAHADGLAPVYPPADALRLAQDRLDEKRLFDELDIPLPGYHPIGSREALGNAVNTLGLPLVIKTRRLGYDGKGQCVVRDEGDLDRAWDELGSVPLIAEQFVAFDFEVSCIGARNVDGEIAIYPLSRNVHRGGILNTSKSPVHADELARVAADYVTRLLAHLDYVGVLALELFVVGEKLLANEFAPRVHNSGHWSIEGSQTSQFENHLRAVLNLALGPTASRGHAGMVNLIGEISESTRSLNVGNLHDYGKAPRAGRKLGHITVIGDTAEARDALVEIIDRNVN